MNKTLPTLQKLATSKGYELRHHAIPLGATEKFDKVISPFDFSSNNGGTLDSIKYYNNFYLYPKNK